MIDGLFNQTNYVAAKKMLDLTALRHEAIASNLAHVETPRYKRLDVSSSFANELQQAASRLQPITDIALSWGFCNLSHFSRVFREHTGTSPTEFRQLKLRQVPLDSPGA